MTDLIESFQRVGIRGGSTGTFALGLGIDQVDIRQTKDMSGHAVGHTVIGMTAFGKVVCRVTVKMFYAGCAGGAFYRTAGTVRSQIAGPVGRVIDETKVIKATLVSPEIRIGISGQHIGSFTANINITGTGCRIICCQNAESILQCDGGTIPTTPDISDFAEAFHSQVALERILARPMWTDNPVPGNQGLDILIVGATENITVDGHQFAAGILDDVQGILGSIVQVGLGQGPGHTGLCQIHFGKESLGAIIIDTAVHIGHFLGKKGHRFFKKEYDILVEILLFHFIDAIVIPGSHLGGDIVNQRSVTESTDNGKIGIGFPGQHFAHALVADFFGAVCRLQTVIQSGAIGINGPQ